VFGDVSLLRGDASEYEEEHECANRSEPEQDDRCARHPWNAVPLQGADRRHGHGRDDRSGDYWPHDLVRGSEQPDDHRQERGDADEQPRCPTEVSQPARRRE
jgi:hypothetical protein